MILCAGEALIDMLPRQTSAGDAAFMPETGGSVFNTAVALGRLDADVAFFNGISTDFFGELLAEDLVASGVDTRFVHRADRPTTLAFVKLVDGQAQYAFYDENSAGRMLGLEDMPGSADLSHVNALFFGCISLVPEPCGATFEALMAREAAAKVTMIDPNIRTSFITDEAAYRARLDRMLAMSDAVKVSDEDLHWLMGAGDTADLAEAMREMGPKVVCITEGSQGVRCFGPNGVIHVAAPKVEVVDTVGAGDTFNAGFLAALQEAGVLRKDWFAAPDDATLTQAVTLGVQAAAITVSRAGANPPTRAEL